MSSRLNVVFVAPFGLKRKTTVWARTLPLAGQLAASGHSATILVPPWDSPETAGHRDLSHGVVLEHICLKGGLPATLKRMIARLGELRPDIVHIVKPLAHAGLVQFWLWQQRRVRPWLLLLDIDDWEQAWAAVNGYPWAVTRFLSWQEEWGLRHAQGITAASHWLMDAAERASPGIPRLYLPNGVAPPISVGQPQPAGDHPRILFFSRFIEVDPAWLAAFWNSLRTQLPAAELVVAGAPVQPRLERPYRDALAGAPGVTWTGLVPPDQLPALYNSATCAIFPAAATALHQAKCSVRLATTLLHGVPVVASAVGEQVYYGADGAARLVADDASPAEFAAAVATVASQPATRADLRARAGSRLLHQYAWPHLAQRLMDFYARLMAGRLTN